MLSSFVRQFTEPDDYAAAIGSTNAEAALTTRGQFTAKLTRIDLHNLRMQRFSEDLPRILHSGARLERAAITFRVQDGPSLRWHRIEMRPTTIIRHSDDHDAFQSSSGPASFGAMSLPIDKFVLIAAAIAGCDLTPPRDELSVTPHVAAMAKLLHLHAAAGHLAEYAPEIIAHPAAAHGLEQALTEAMVACLSTAGVAEDSSAHHRHALIMRRFHAVIAERPREAMYIPDLCAAVGVPQRTLNLCCHESLGVSPKRYLLLRRMELTRQALRRADAAATVTDIAVGFGFWNLGRFAIEYRAQFGESPSATLRREPR